MRNYTQEYKYDEIGNITEMKSNGVWTRDYRYDFVNNNYLLDHDLQGTTDIYEYDAHGNTTKMPHLQELKYDYADQLNEVTLDASGNKAYYVYNASGERVRKVVVKNNGTIVEDRFYIGDYEIYSKKTNGTLDVERETLHIVDDKSKLALIDYDTQNLTTTIRYQYTNHLDSASLELDETGDIISYEEYHPFGTTSYRSGRSEIDVSLKRYKYVHKELDNETSLYYYGMRYYTPWIARFISVDPLQLKFPHLTPFQYASNDPIGAIDLDGAESTKELDDKRVFSWVISNTEPIETEKAFSEGVESHTGDAYDVQYQIDRRIDNPGILVNDVYSFFAGIVETASQISMDMSGTSELLGYENKTVSAVQTGIYTISNIPNMSNYELGQVFGATAKISFQLLLTKKIAGELNAFKLPEFKIYPEISKININRYDLNSKNILNKLESETPGAHFYSRHGAQTTEWDQFLRSHIGITPDDVFKKPIASSKYYSNQIQLNAYQHANRIYKSTGQTSFEFGMGYNVGGGYLKNGLIFHETNISFAVFNNEGKLKTLFPLLKK